LFKVQVTVDKVFILHCKLQIKLQSALGRLIWL